MHRGRILGGALWLAACACSASGTGAAPTAAPSATAVDLTVCEGDQSFLGEIDRRYADDTTFLDSETKNDTTIQQTRRSLRPYLEALEGHIRLLRSRHVSPPYDPSAWGSCTGYRTSSEACVWSTSGAGSARRRGEAIWSPGAARS
jgi:hypothetical protein